MVEESYQNVFLIQIDASSFAEFEISEFEISRFNCICLPGCAVPTPEDEVCYISHVPTAAPNRIKDFLDLLGDSGLSGLTLQLFPIVILVIEVVGIIPLETIVMSNLISQNKSINQ